MAELQNTWCITVKGKVQGVFFRVSAQKVAAQYQITGIVKNKANGDVYMELQGTETSLGKMSEWAKKGPDMARVDRIEIKTSQKETFTGFNIIR